MSRYLGPAAYVSGTNPSHPGEIKGLSRQRSVPPKQPRKGTSDFMAFGIRGIADGIAGLAKYKIQWMLLPR